MHNLSSRLRCLHVSETRTNEDKLLQISTTCPPGCRAYVFQKKPTTTNCRHNRDMSFQLCCSHDSETRTNVDKLFETGATFFSNLLCLQFACFGDKKQRGHMFCHSHNLLNVMFCLQARSLGRYLRFWIIVCSSLETVSRRTNAASQGRHVDTYCCHFCNFISCRGPSLCLVFLSCPRCRVFMSAACPHSGSSLFSTLHQANICFRLGACCKEDRQAFPCPSLACSGGTLFLRAWLVVLAKVKAR